MGGAVSASTLCSSRHSSKILCSFLMGSSFYTLLYYTILYYAIQTPLYWYYGAPNGHWDQTTKSHYWEGSSSLTNAFLFINVRSREFFVNFAQSLIWESVHFLIQCHSNRLDVTSEFITFCIATRHTSVKNWSSDMYKYSDEGAIWSKWNYIEAFGLGTN